MMIRPSHRSRWPFALVQLSAVLALLVIVPSAGAQNVSGTLAVQKIVVNQVDPSVPIPSLFNTTTHCSQNAASPPSHTPVNVADGQTVTQSTTMLPGISCSITEAVPPPISGLNACKGRDAVWTANYSPPVTIVAGQTALLTVTNTLACAAPTGGSLQVYKNVVNTLGVPNPSTFAMVASCSGMAAVPLNVAPSQSVTVSNNVPGGTVCTVTETLPPPVLGVKACPSGRASWIQTNPGPQTVQVAQTTGIIITNTLTCDTAPPPPSTGRLRVVKSVINQVAGSVTLPTTYPMSVTCTPNGPGNQSISVPAGSVGALISVPAPSQCVVTEAPLPPLTNVKGCPSGTASWTTMGSPSSPVTIPANGVATVTIRNILNCDKPPVADCPNPNQTTIGCRITVTIKRKKGAPIYSVLVSPTAPMPNVVAPSTPSSCVIGSNVMINQTTCWFNYSTNPTTVTLTATSSTGVLPTGFSWSGGCAGTNPICVLPASMVQQLVTANFP